MKSCLFHLLLKLDLNTSTMKRRIAFITEHAPYLKGDRPSGNSDENADLSELTNHLCAKGWAVDVITAGAHGGDARVTDCGPNLRLIEIDACLSADSAKLTALDDKRFHLGIERFLRDNSLAYELIHANLSKSGAIAVSLKKKLKIPIVVTLSQNCDVNGIAAADNSVKDVPWKKNVQILKKADALIVDCANTKTALVDRYRPSLQKTFVVPAGFNPETILPVSKEQARIRLNLSANEKILLFVGDLDQGNACEPIIKSLTLLDGPGSKVRFILLQEFEKVQVTNKDKLLRIAESLGLKEQIMFIDKPAAEDLNCYYSAADLFFTTTLSRNSSMLALKSMAFGTPVVVMGEGDLKAPAHVIDGKTGFVLSELDPEVLADRINLVLKNERLLNQMGREATDHVYSSFTWEKIAARMLPLYDYVLSATRRKQDLVEVSLKKKTKKSAGPAIFQKRDILAKFGN
jgi:D-inositol-3-phosphate glycosyltransferase